MIRPLDSSFDATYYDGRVAVRHQAEVRIREAGLLVTVDGAGVPQEPMQWIYADTRFATEGTYGEPVRMERASGETLVVDSTNFIEALQQHGVVRKTIPLDLKGWPSVLLCLIFISILGSVYYSLGVSWAAELAARFMPPAWEDRLGRSVVAVLAPEYNRCKNPEALPRLQTVVNRLSSAAGRKFEVLYTNQAMVNAFAAPGGYIVVFQGLLQSAASAEEFAGVLSHEMQHVLLKHSTRAIAREFSGRALLSLMVMDSGGTPSAMQAAARLANLGYQRSDEEAADSAGVTLLARAKVQPAGLSTFFQRLERSSVGESSLRYLSTHPAMSERTETLRRQISNLSVQAEPLMTAQEWAQAQRVCRTN